MRAWIRGLATATLVGLAMIPTATALACGGLIAPDGDVRLERAATMIAWHNGIEHYLTSFSYGGTESHVGWIVPLPAVPTSVEPGGKWTLQRLAREVSPPSVEFNGGGIAPVTASASSVDILQKTQIEALDITVLRGNGQGVLDWAASNGFAVNADERAHLIQYAKGSPIFMAAQYDTSAAKARNQQTGDGAAVLITMPTAHPWVPLEILALDGQQVQADLYFLTDMPLNTREINVALGQSAVGSDVPGGTGLRVAFQESMNAQLFHDLSTDRNMGWVRSDGWLTHLSLNAPDTKVTYDLGISSAGIIHLAPYGTAPMAVIESAKTRDLPTWVPTLPLGTPQTLLVILIVALTGGVALRLIIRARRTPVTSGQ